MSSKIVVTENIRIDGSDYTLGQELGTIDSPISLPTLAMMVNLGQARIVSDPLVVPPSGGNRTRTEPNEPNQTTEPPTDDSPLGSYDIPDRFVDLLAEQTPPILFRQDVVDYLETHDDLTPISGIGKTTSDRILSALGLA